MMEWAEWHLLTDASRTTDAESGAASADTVRRASVTIAATAKVKRVANRAGKEGAGDRRQGGARPAWLPRLYYGWVMLLALGWTQITSWGILYYAFSVFVTPMADDLGWSRAAITGAFSVALLCSGLTALLVGRWVDQHGPRLVMSAGSCLAALLLMAWSRVDQLLLFYLIWAGIGATTAAVFYEPAFAAVATWFVRYRSRALTILTFLGGLASVIYIPLAAWLVRDYGWRTAIVVLAMLLAVLTIPPHLLLLRRRPSDLGLLPDGEVPVAEAEAERPVEVSVSAREAIRSRSFRWLATAFCLAFLVNVAVTVHLIPYLLEAGFSAGFAASAAGLVGLMAMPGRLIFTPLGGRIPRRYITVMIFAVQAVALVALVTIPTRLGVGIFVALFGVGFGAITPARAAFVAELYGPQHYGSISGVLALLVTLARALGPVTAGLLYGVWSGYVPVLWACAGVALAAAAAAYLIEPPARSRLAV